MEKEQQARKVTAIHIDLIERSVAIEIAGDEAPRVVVEDGVFAIAAAALASVGTKETTATETGGAPENETTVVLSGQLRATAKEGRPDRHGKATAWAPFVGKTDDEEIPRHYSATFYRNAAPIVLSLEQGAPLTVRGFVRPDTNPEKNNRPSVVSVLDYPGKPQREAPSVEEGGQIIQETSLP